MDAIGRGVVLRIRPIPTGKRKMTGSRGKRRSKQHGKRRKEDGREVDGLVVRYVMII